MEQLLKKHTIVSREKRVRTGSRRQLALCFPFLCYLLSPPFSFSCKTTFLHTSFAYHNQTHTQSLPPPSLPTHREKTTQKKETSKTTEDSGISFFFRTQRQHMNAQTHKIISFSLSQTHTQNSPATNDVGSSPPHVTFFSPFLPSLALTSLDRSLSRSRCHIFCSQEEKTHTPFLCPLSLSLPVSLSRSCATRAPWPNGSWTAPPCPRPSSGLLRTPRWLHAQTSPASCRWRVRIARPAGSPRT